jgi:hypothetical protein
MRILIPNNKGLEEKYGKISHTKLKTFQTLALNNVKFCVQSVNGRSAVHKRKLNLVFI